MGQEMWVLSWGSLLFLPVTQLPLIYIKLIVVNLVCFDKPDWFYSYASFDFHVSFMPTNIYTQAKPHRHTPPQPPAAAAAAGTV